MSPLDYLKIAVAKGRTEKGAAATFRKAGFKGYVGSESYRLTCTCEEENITFIHVKPLDVTTYVQDGAADLGIVGKDMLLENSSILYEISDLGFGKCKLVVAGLKDQYPRGKEETLKVATSYPNITKAYFGEKKQKIRVVKLGGSVELAPLLGLSDVIVDLVETGSTLKANGLKVIEEISEVSAKLVANRISYRFKYESINQLVKRLEEVCP